MDFHYATKHGEKTANIRGVAQASWCITEAIQQLLIIFLKNMDILLQQYLVIPYFVLLNVASVPSLDSRVFLAEATTKITKYFYISLDVLIWMISGIVLQELSPN